MILTITANVECELEDPSQLMTKSDKGEGKEITDVPERKAARGVGTCAVLLTITTMQLNCSCLLQLQLKLVVKSLDTKHNGTK